MRGDNRAVSEVLGYVLVFALVTATVGIVFTVGMGGLQSAQQSEQVNNVERAFDVLSHNIEDMYRRDAPSRATEIRLIGGNLGYDERINITTETANFNQTIHPQPIVYRSDGGTEIAYEAGAIIRTDGDSSVMLREPDFRIDDRYSSITVVRSLRSVGSSTEIQGDRVVLVVGTNRGSNIYLADDDPEEVTITINSTRADAWERYFERTHDNVEINGNESTIEVTFETDRIRLIRPRIDFELIA